MKILIVDDSRVMRQIVARTLRQAGYGAHAVVEAADGREALVAVHRHEPDVVLSDWNLPQLDGLELLAALRDSGNDVPFGFVTSECAPEMVARATAAGAAFVITKPFTAESFHEGLGPVLGSAA